MSDVLLIRRATMEDAKTLWYWTNDPAVRRNSLNVDAVLWESHLVWLERKIESKDCLLLIAELEGVPVAMVRFDKKNAEATISISVAQGHRGHGLGKRAMAAGMELVLHTWELDQLRAYVKPENAGSLALFEGLGFNRLELADLGVCKAWLFVRPVGAEAEAAL
jgi:RimJ/RimL family protein N-acetyltransferase